MAAFTQAPHRAGRSAFGPEVDSDPVATAELSVLVSLVHHAAAIDGADTPEVLAEMVRSAAPWADVRSVESVVAAVRRRMLGLGEIEPLLALHDVSDVLINGPGPVYVERSGRLCESGVVLDSDGIRLLIDRIAALTHRRPDLRTPVVECSLPAGHRVAIAIPPVATSGPVIAIRRHRRDLSGLGSFGERRPGLLDSLAEAVADGASILVAGATGAGKTTLLGALLDLVADDERIVLIEDVAEVATSHPDVARLVARQNAPGVDEVGLGELVRLALRLRPDRIVVGEVRGSEAGHLVQALSTGHRGGLASIHAAGVTTAVARLTTLCEVDSATGRRTSAEYQLEFAFDLVAVVERDRQGRRSVVDVAAFDLGVIR